MGHKTQYTSDPVCPHCGHEMRDAWELRFVGTSDEVTVTCGKCECEYICHREVTVEYCTRRTPDDVIKSAGGGQ